MNPVVNTTVSSGDYAAPHPRLMDRVASTQKVLEKGSASSGGERELVVGGAAFADAAVDEALARAAPTPHAFG